MAMTVDAVYEDGVLKPSTPLPLNEHDRIRVTLHLPTSVARETYGMMGWTGSAELADYFALDPELDFPPPAGAS